MAVLAVLASGLPAAHSCSEAVPIHGGLSFGLRHMLPDSIRGTQVREIHNRFDRIGGGHQLASSQPSEGGAGGAHPKARPAPEAGRAAASPGGTMRRGGYGDAMGATADNKMAVVEPIPVQNEHQLSREMEQIKLGLAPAEMRCVGSSRV